MECLGLRLLKTLEMLKVKEVGFVANCGGTDQKCVHIKHSTILFTIHLMKTSLKFLCETFYINVEENI